LAEIKDSDQKAVNLGVDTGDAVKMNALSKEFTIVVTDDSPLYRTLVQETLAQEQYQVFTAKNGREALDLITEHRPAVVVTDWEMPDLSGLQLCEVIRGGGDTYTYIILLTSNKEKDQIIQGLRAGADDYLTKPFHSGELIARVAVGLRVAELHREIQAKNKLLEELALTDSLTGLPNRRAMEQWAVRELKGAARHGFDFWVVMADLDRFKSVNDSYGHSTGDLVLKRFAEILRTNTRSSNMCSRVGGEEFVLVLTHVERRDVVTAIDRIRRYLEREQFLVQGQLLNVTASFGISGFKNHTDPEWEELVRQADVALYAAKHGGRNRIEFFSGLSAEPELVAASRQINARGGSF